RLSAGIAVQARPEDTGETLMRNADIALNAAKSAGTGRWVQYGPEQHASVSDRMELEVDLAHALERRQLVLHYQPAVRLADGAIVGFEAFVRWSHPRRGMVSPADFIPLADETGLIVPLQRWVLGQACADGRQWQLGYPVASGLTMSVNVSQRGLAHPDLVADVTQVCVAARFDPLHLVLELTQGATLKGKETIDRLIELHQRGVKLALDDFGADSAPLSALRDLPVDIVKLDQSFVARMTSSPTDATVARAVIDLGNTLGMMTMADGIERAEQLVALQRIGCTAGQGYYLSRPLPASGIERLRVSTWSALAVGIAFLLSEAIMLDARIRDYDEGVYWATFRALARGEPMFSTVFATSPPGFFYALLPFYLVVHSLASLRAGVP